MAKLTRTVNPITSGGGDILSPTDWVQRILWVAMFGAVFSIGAKVLSAADKFIPGDNTPAGYKNANAIQAPAGGPVIY